MTETSTQREYTLDASGKKIGRLASEIATLLIGKKESDFAPNKVIDMIVRVTNASKLDISETKKDEKEYFHYTGFHGGGRHTPLRRVIENKGYGEVIRRAVKGMLPKNKLQDKRLANLVVEE
jgi:large subunit ribosomal protein L13